MRRPVRLVTAAALAVGAGLLIPAVAPTSSAPTSTVTTATVSQSDRVETELVESVDAAGQVVATTSTTYRVVTTTSCRRAPSGRVCSDKTVRLPVAATEAPAPTSGLRGSASAYAFMVTDSSKRPAHWNRCSTIRYRVNPAGLPAGALAEVHTAMARLSKASGFKVAYAGATTVVPYSKDWAAAIPASQNSDIFIAWSDESKVPALKGSVAGLGGPSWQRVSGREPRIVRGAVVIDRAAPVAPGFGDGTSRGSLLLHELGHALNLAHVADRYQVMHATVHADSRGDFQAGDRAGLAKLASYACF